MNYFYEFIIITSNKNVDTTIAAITGFSCIHPVITAINHNKTILIANKEILVSAGNMIISQLRNSKAVMLPIDSEHNALLQIILSSGLEYKINDEDYYKAKVKNISFDDMKTEILSGASLNRFVTHEDLAEQAHFLCSPLGRNISGQAVSVCGNIEKSG